MQFEKVTIELLRALKDQGYNVLISNNKLTDPQVYWYAEQIDSIVKYRFRLKDMGYNPTLRHPMMLRIQYALDNIEEEELKGVVFITKKRASLP